MDNSEERNTQMTDSGDAQNTQAADTSQEGKPIGLRSSLAAKTIAVILLAVMAMAAIASGAGIIYLAGDDCWGDGVTFYDSSLCGSITNDYAYRFYRGIDWTAETNADYTASLIDDPKGVYNPANTNFLFVLTATDDYNKQNNFKTQNCNGESVSAPQTYEYTSYYDIYDYEGLVLAGHAVVLKLDMYVRNPLTVKDDYWYAKTAFDFLHLNRYNLIWVCAASLLLAVALFVFLLRSAGHKRGVEGIRRNWFDKIPLDLIALVIFALACLAVSVIDYWWSLPVQFAVTAVYVLVLGLMLLAFLMTLATRLKLGRFWENTITWRVLKLLGGILVKVFLKLFSWIPGFFKKLGSASAFLIGKLPIIWKFALAFAGILLSNFLMTYGLFHSLSYGSSGGFLTIAFFLLLFDGAALVCLCYIAIHLDRLKTAGKALASGDLGYKADTTGMRWDIKTHADNLGSIGEGMALAVEERMKSERFKTELITNVSHDIKTPLTSIINYVDLLKKEGSDSEKTAEYLEVLERQSQRLKKLTEDIVEASKATSGAINVNLEASNVSELLRQVAGEYEARLGDANLVSVVTTPGYPVLVMTDGKLMWRVFDNLLGNIRKYSMPGTRVYFSVEDKNGKARIRLMNISREPLNVHSDELMERFVRGDYSRAGGEGSGLGLSIARSLTELCGGRFELAIDGDLFKVTITFDKTDIN